MPIVEKEFRTLEIRNLIKKDPHLSAIFETCVLEEVVEDERAMQQGYFRAAPPDVEKFFDEVTEAYTYDLANYATGLARATPDEIVAKIEKLQRGLAEARILGWISHAYDRSNKAEPPEQFAVHYLQNQIL